MDFMNILVAFAAVGGIALILGILLAVFAVLGLSTDISGTVNLGNIGALVCFGLLLASFVLFANKAAKETK